MTLKASAELAAILARKPTPDLEIVAGYLSGEITTRPAGTRQKSARRFQGRFRKAALSALARPAKIDQATPHAGGYLAHAAPHVRRTHNEPSGLRQDRRRRSGATRRLSPNTRRDRGARRHVAQNSETRTGSARRIELDHGRSP